MEVSFLFLLEKEEMYTILIQNKKTFLNSSKHRRYAI